MEGSKSQSPHFKPLLNEANEELREFAAIGMLVTFGMLLDKVKKLRLDDDEDFTNRLNSFSGILAELEKNGFDVATPQKQIRKMLSLKEMREKKAEEKKRFEEKIEVEDREKRKIEEEIAELKRAEAAAKQKKEAVEKKIVEMKSSTEVIEQEIEDIELEFHNTVLAPW